MKRAITALAMIAMGLPASGCVTAAIAKDPAGTITALGNAGCRGTLDVGADVASAAGVSPGSGSGHVHFVGTCDPHPVATPPS